MATQAEQVQVGEYQVRLSSPDKVYFPERGITKRQVLDYFLSVGDGILGALRHRPTTLERWPGGVREGVAIGQRIDGKAEAFYQKRVPKGAPDFVDTVQIAFPSGRKADEVCPENLAVVAWAANLGTITFHPWPVTKTAVDHPDQLRIDLDPQPGTDFTDAVTVSVVVRELLDSYGLTGFPKTSGGRGLHIFVPIEANWTFVEVRRAVIALGRQVADEMPGQATVNWWKEERGERVFVDYNQMARDRTMASAYSVRANPRATVSAPLTWDEVGDVSPEDFDVLTMPARFAAVGDPHANIGAMPGDLSALLERVARDETDRGLADMPYPPEYPKMPGEPLRVQPSRAKKP